MATRTKPLVASALTNTDVWEGRTGAEVENYIKDLFDSVDAAIESNSKKIPRHATYLNSELRFYPNDEAKEEEELFHVTVSVAQVDMVHQLYIGNLYYNNELVVSGKPIAYQKSGKYELEIALTKYSLRLDDGNKHDISAALKISVKLGNVQEEFFVTPIPNESVDNNGVPKENAVVPRITLTERLLKLFFNNAQFEVTYNPGKDYDTIVKSSNSTYNVLNPSISYENPYILTNKSVDFKVSGISKYRLIGFCEDRSLQPVVGNSITELRDGLNLLLIKAVSTENSAIETDYITVNIIYASSEVKTSQVAINNVNLSLGNNGVSEICKIDVYSPARSEVNISTYLDEIQDGTSSKLEDIDITEDKYDKVKRTFSTTVSTYIELALAGELYLKITVNGLRYKNWISYDSISGSGVETLASSLDYWVMLISDPIENILPYSETTPSLLWSQANKDLSVFDDHNEMPILDGRIQDSGLTAFKISARNNHWYKSETKDLNLGNLFTLEFGIKSYNISDENTYIMKIGDLVIKPTEVGWNEPDITSSKYLNSNASFLLDSITHIAITFNPAQTLTSNEPYYPNYLLTYQSNFNNCAKEYSNVKIYINGVVQREMKLEDYNFSGGLDIFPRTADVNFYLLRVYNNKCLTEEQVRLNYRSFIPSVEKKLDNFTRNDIVGDNGEISLAKACKLYNCIVYVMPKGYTLLNRAYGNKDDDRIKALKKLKAAMFIHYKDEAANNLYGGKITNVSLSPQGSSAMTYGIWNVLGKVGEFTTEDEWSDVLYDTSELAQAASVDGGAPKESDGKFKAQISIAGNESIWYVPNGETRKDYILLPLMNPDLTLVSGSTTTDGIKIKKAVGKVNWASSMQSHKPGACNLFNDSYTGTNRTTGRKAVKELPFLYFYVEGNYDDTSILEWDDIVEVAKFAGILTWGSAKCDKATYGYNKKTTPEYLLLEGAENGADPTNFMVPWQAMLHWGADSNTTSVTPTIGKDESIANPWSNLLIKKESIYYLDDKLACWDIDFGANDAENGFNTKVYKSLKKFREFYDFAYTYDLDILYVSTFADLASWVQSKKYCVTNALSSARVPAGIIHEAYDTYRYCALQKTWIHAGVYYNDGWEHFNTKTLSGLTTNVNETTIKLAFKNIFYSNISNYIDIEDMAHHLAAMKILSGTDNRAKNTYFRIVGPIYKLNEETSKYVALDDDYKVTMMLDDLDTIFITDNLGKQSKPYNLIEASYDPSLASYWGDNDHNVFFRSFDRTYENEIKKLVRNILERQLPTTDINNTNTNFYKNFFTILEYFPEVVWNHTAKMYYETWQYVKDGRYNNAEIINGYTNNNEEPLSQSHGNLLEGEKAFMLKRLEFLQSYARSLGKVDYIQLNTNKTPGNSNNVFLKMSYTPFRDFFPTYIYGGSEGASLDYLNEAKTKTYDILDYRAVTGESYECSTPGDTSGTMHGVPQTWLYKTATISRLLSENFQGKWSHLTDLTIVNEEFEVSKLKYHSKLTQISAELPVLLNLTIKDMELPYILDFSTNEKLVSVDLSTCSGLNTLVLPSTSTLTTLRLPSTLNSLTLNGLSGLNVISIEDWSSISSISLTNISNRKIEEILESATNARKISLGSNKYPIEITISEGLFNRLVSAEFTFVGKITLSGNINFNTAKKIYFKLKSLPSGESFNVLYTKQTINNSDITILRNPTISGSEHILNLISVGSGNDVLGLLDKTSISKTSSTATGGVVRDQYYIDSTTGRYGKVDGKFNVRIGTTTTEIIVSFTYHMPQPGDFAYGDGSFSNILDQVSKDFVGIVYAVDEDYAYIVGKEYVNINGDSFIGGIDYKSVSETDAVRNHYRANESEWFSMYDVYSSMTTTAQLSLANRINTLESIDKGLTGAPVIGLTVSTSYFKGYENTNLIVNAASNKADSSNSAIFNGSMSNCINFPYYQAAWVYKPSFNQTNIHENYKTDHWYVPNIYELNDVLTKLAVSCRTDNGSFTSAWLESPVKSSNSDLSGVPAVFSIAQSHSLNVSWWKNLAEAIKVASWYEDSYNINALLTSSVSNGSPMNSYYLTYTSDTGGKSYTYAIGSYSFNNTSDWMYKNFNGWCGRPHKLIPFFRFDLSKVEQ